MPVASLRCSHLVARLRSWLKGSRLRITGQDHHCLRHNALLFGTHIEIVGTGCTVEIGPGARLWDCSITIAGRGAVLRIGAGCRLRKARLVVEDDGSVLLIGDSTSMTGPTILSQEGRRVQIGRDCMVAQHAEIRNSDSHGIHDATTGDRLNPAADVLIGDHVWIGLHTFVFKGARIGDGAIVAARSLVTGEIPPACIALGTPARCVKEGIAWKRARTASAALPAS